MAFKFVVFIASLAMASAGLINAPGHLAYTGPQVAYSSAPSVSSVYSSVHTAPVVSHYAAPAVHAAPVLSHYAAPAVHAAPALAYSSPIISKSYSAAPAVSSVYSSVAAAPVAYAPAHVSYAAPAHLGAIGTSHQSTLRSLDGNSAISHYSKAVDTAYSSVRKVDTRITNDAKYAVAAPVVSHYSSPVLSHYSAPAVSYAHAAPAVSYASHAAPLAYASHAAPLAYASHAAPLAYASHAAPALTYAAHAPVVKSIGYSAAPVVAHASFQGLGTQYAW